MLELGGLGSPRLATIPRSADFEGGGVKSSAAHRPSCTRPPPKSSCGALGSAPAASNARTRGQVDAHRAWCRIGSAVPSTQQTPAYQALAPAIDAPGPNLGPEALAGARARRPEIEPERPSARARGDDRGAKTRFARRPLSPHTIFPANLRRYRNFFRSLLCSSSLRLRARCGGGLAGESNFFAVRLPGLQTRVLSQLRTAVKPIVRRAYSFP